MEYQYVNEIFMRHIGLPFCNAALTMALLPGPACDGLRLAIPRAPQNSSRFHELNVQIEWVPRAVNAPYLDTAGETPGEFDG
jgi:hypothetical protein